MTRNEIIELMASGTYGSGWNGPLDKMPGEKMKQVWRNYSERALTALEAAGYVIERGWRPIEEAPKDGSRILLDWNGTRVGFFLDNSAKSIPWAGWRVPSGDTQPSGRPTHFRHLPSPPETEPR